MQARDRVSRNWAEVEVEIREFEGDGRTVLFGIPERREFVDAPEYVDDSPRHRARGHRMACTPCSIATDDPEVFLEGVLGGLTVGWWTPARAVG